ncbi:MAG: flagellar hook capping FlgD N-terminal domain-containing protein [Candidatus Scalindua sp.]
MENAAIGSSTVNQDEFLRLFVAQLQNQSPMDPLKGADFIAQLAQFSSLEQLTNLNASFADNLKFQQLAGGSEFIGKKATYVDPAAGGPAEGVIQGAITRDGSISLVIQNGEIPISNITGIFENK